jgi:hypothetical protein
LDRLKTTGFFESVSDSLTSVKRNRGVKMAGFPGRQKHTVAKIARALAGRYGLA